MHVHFHNHRKEFIDTYSEVLMKFRITGTQTTMRMCKSMWGEGKMVGLTLGICLSYNCLDMIAHPTHNFPVRQT